MHKTNIDNKRKKPDSKVQEDCLKILYGPGDNESISGLEDNDKTGIEKPLELSDTSHEIKTIHVLYLMKKEDAQELINRNPRAKIILPVPFKWVIVSVEFIDEKVRFLQKDSPLLTADNVIGTTNQKLVTNHNESLSYPGEKSLRKKRNDGKPRVL